LPERPRGAWLCDGSANSHRFEQAAADAEVAFEYVPVTPERSSTGMYSGGPPRRGRLAPGDARVDELWRRALALESAPALRTELRAKGTGAFAVATRPASATSSSTGAPHCANSTPSWPSWRRARVDRHKGQTSLSQPVTSAAGRDRDFWLRTSAPSRATTASPTSASCFSVRATAMKSARP